MLKWLVTVLVVLVVLAIVAPRFGAWRLPGDLRVPVRGRMYYIPIASTLVFSLLVWMVSKVL
jgi:Protein of unknown function (DUF2905)